MPNTSPTMKRAGRGVAILSSAGLVAGLSMAPHANAAARDWWGGGSCPKAESLVAGTTFHTHTLAPGVTLSEGDKTDGQGVVKMHVLRITVGQRGVSFQPLMHSVANRTPLSKLAAGHRHLVAAVNTGYFDFDTGAPLQPLIVNSTPVVMAGHYERVFGFNQAHAVQYGRVRLDATLYSGKRSYHVSGVNEVLTGNGIETYNGSWGARAIPSDWEFDARSVLNAKLGGNAGRDARVPSGGYEVAADGGDATHWLSTLSSGAATGLAGKVQSTTKQPFVQAYGVGVELVENYGQVRNDLPCDSANTITPARTAIGYANNGKTIVIGEVEDHPGTSVHGLDENQMSGFMAQLGVDRAFLLDGSGSTEMLAKMPGTSSLSMRTYPADGAERPMPVGLGISYVKPPVHHHHRHHHRRR